MSYISSFERELVGLAAAKRCDGIICGHIHQPADTWIDGIHYLNSGDWVETAHWLRTPTATGASSNTTSANALRGPGARRPSDF